MPRISKVTGRPVITARRGVHEFTDEKRMFLHLIFTELDLPPDDTASLMHACFPDMMSVGYDATFRKFQDIWNGRNNSTHAKSWWRIARPRPAHKDRPANNTPYSATELADWATIRGQVHATAQAHGIVIAYKNTTTVGELGGPNLQAGQVLPQPLSLPGPAANAHAAIANNTTNANNTTSTHVSARKLTAAAKKRKATSSRAAQRKKVMKKRRKDDSEDEADADEDVDGIENEVMEDDAQDEDLEGGEARSAGEAAKRVTWADDGEEELNEAELYEREMDQAFGGETMAGNDETEPEEHSTHHALHMDPVVQEVLGAPVFSNTAAWMRQNGLR